MEWYFVVKTIKGRRYLYKQKTWREGRRVRTANIYIGPAGDWLAVPRIPSGATTLPLPFPEKTREYRPESLAASLTALTNPEHRFAGWEHHWDENRRGSVEVEAQPEIDDLVTSLGVQFTESTDGAYYSPSKGNVNIPPRHCFTEMNGQSATSAYYVVLFHELAHWTAAPGRLERKTGDRFGTMWYAREELVAELSAVMLMEHFGLEIGNIGRHAHYFQSWKTSCGSDSATMRHVRKEAERAVRFILGRGTIRS